MSPAADSRPSAWREALARGLYSAALVLLAPVYRLRLGWRGRVEPGYREAVAERFGRYRDAPSSGWLWLHAVSLGETRAASALVAALRRERPNLRLLLTHGTATGREAGRALLREGDRQAWLPYDTPGAVRRFLRHFQPAMGVLMETEIWPNLMQAASRQGLPVVLANARLSEKSQRRGERMASLLRPAAQRLSLALAQTEADAQRLRGFGVPEVQVAGNLKFDVAPDPRLVDAGRHWRAALARPVVLAASTREGEEAMLLAAWRSLHANNARARLLIVPRHPQRFDEVAGLVERSGYTCARRSTWQGTGPPPQGADNEVWLGDSMGEMPLYYALARVALLGGSYAPLGGQNLIEAAACACPVVLGPHTFNFADAAEGGVAAGAALRVGDMGQGVAEALALVEDRERHADAVAAALAFAVAHRGAALRMAREILQRMA